MRKLSVLKQYKFPEIRDIRYIGENYLWWQIDAKYKQYCTNEIFRIYFPSEDALTRLTPNFEGMYTRYHNQILQINDIYGKYAPILSKNFCFTCISLWNTIFFLKREKCDIGGINSLTKKAILLGFSVPGWLYHKIIFKHKSKPST